MIRIPDLKREVQGFMRLMKINPYIIKRIACDWSSVVNNTEAIIVNFISPIKVPQKREFLHFEVEIVGDENYPRTEPYGLLIYPNISRFIQGIHTYKNFDGRLICAHIRDWGSDMKMADYFERAVFPWANNLVAWASTNRQWNEKCWDTNLRR